MSRQNLAFLLSGVLILVAALLGSIWFIVDILEKITGLPAGIMILLTLTGAALVVGIIACKVLDSVFGIFRHGSTVALAASMILVFGVIMWGGGRVWFAACDIRQWSWAFAWLTYSIFWLGTVAALALWLRVAGFTAKRASVFAFPIAALMLTIWGAMDSAQYSAFVSTWDGSPLVAASNCDQDATFGPFSDAAHPVPINAEYDRMCFVPAAEFIKIDLSQEAHRELLRQWDEQGLGIGDDPQGTWMKWRRAWRQSQQARQAAGTTATNPLDAALNAADALTGGRLGVSNGGSVSGTSVSDNGMTAAYGWFFGIIAVCTLLGGVMGGFRNWGSCGAAGMAVGGLLALLYGQLYQGDWLFVARTSTVADLPQAVHMTMNSEVQYALDMPNLKHQAKAPVFAYVCEARYPVNLAVQYGDRGWRDNNLSILRGTELQYDGSLDDGRLITTFRMIPLMGPNGALMTEAYIVFSLGAEDPSLCPMGTRGYNVWQISQSTATPVAPVVPTPTQPSTVVQPTVVPTPT
ncbi:MAG: hypothetical protein KKI02_10095, partial [Planctomycetes bacterium]|nr:hypothetical protein [Planctomycetota bacterium]